MSLANNFMVKKRLILILFFFSGLGFLAYLMVFKKARPKELEAIITDGRFKKEKVAYFEAQKIKAPLKSYPITQDLEKVLSAAYDDSKWIEVDLTKQKLRAWQGRKLVYEFPVSTGKKQWGTETPVGVYRIWIKLRSTKMEGGSGSHYYYLPNVACTQYFYKGYGIHGTYWHHNFGHPMSHGCVNMSNKDACTLFYWTSPLISGNKYVSRPSKDELGTRVVVHGKTPWQ